MPEEITQEPQGQSSQQTTDPTKSVGQSTQEDLPEQFKGKSAKEIADAYISLQQKLGQQGTELGQTRQQLQQWNELDQWLTQNDPELVALITKKIQASRNQVPSQNQQPQQNAETAQLRAEVSDTRLATQQGVIDRFENKFGINQLENKDRETLQRKIGQEIKELRDPGGNKDLGQIIAETPLNILQSVFEKAYKLATVDDTKEKERVTSMRVPKEDPASFSSMPSRGIRQDQTSLTPEQIRVAERLGIGKDKYLKNVKEIAAEYQ